jgi:hypothetical protein
MKRFAVLSTVALFSLARRESSTIASEIKQLRPNIRIVMVAENSELAAAAFESHIGPSLLPLGCCPLRA